MFVENTYLAIHITRNNMLDLCCIGHITNDKVVTTKTTMYMAGGTAWYFSCAVAKLDINYLLATAVADAEIHYADDLRHKGIDVKVQPSAHTVHFENIYGENQDERTQRVSAKADPFDIALLGSIDTKIFHLGPLLADDISTELIKKLANKARISLDVQGYLRRVEDEKVYPTNWPDRQEALQYVDIVKADVGELRALTGLDGIQEGIWLLADWGVKEIVITNGSGGSLIYSEDKFHTIPAYKPRTIVDATGCGDTYMAGYLYSRLKGVPIQQSGEFAAAMASLKMENSGAFNGTKEDVEAVLTAHRK